jgi:hypothetical protein
MRQMLSQGMKNMLAVKNFPSHLESEQGAVEEAARALAVINGALYLYAAARLDESHLKALAREIDAGLGETAGVLIGRLTIRRPDGAGNTLPEYVGLQVVGFGGDSDEALAKADPKSSQPQECIEVAKRKYCAPKEALRLKPGSGDVCTPGNPTGEKPKERPSMRAAPAGYNMGYAAQVAAKLSPVMSLNPTNDKDGIVFTQTYVERELIWITAREWKLKKASW